MLNSWIGRRLPFDMGVVHQQNNGIIKQTFCRGVLITITKTVLKKLRERWFVVTSVEGVNSKLQNCILSISDSTIFWSKTITT